MTEAEIRADERKKLAERLTQRMRGGDWGCDLCSSLEEPISSETCFSCKNGNNFVFNLEFDGVNDE